MPGAKLAPTELQRAEQREMLALVAAGDAVEQLETTRVTKDGRLLDIDLTSSPLRDASGRIVGVSSDLPRHHRAQARRGGARRGARAVPLRVRGLAGRDGAARPRLPLRADQRRVLRDRRPPARAAARDAVRLADPSRRRRARAGGHLRGARRRAPLLRESRSAACTPPGSEISVAVNLTALRHPGGEPMRLLAHVQDITDRKRHERQLVYLSDHDALTGLPNRRAFARLLSAHGAIVERYGQVGTLLVIDLDDFRSVNETLGRSVPTRCSSRSRACSPRGCGARTCSPGSAATSSACCCRWRTPRPRRVVAADLLGGAAQRDGSGSAAPSARSPPASGSPHSTVRSVPTTCSSTPTSRSGMPSRARATALSSFAPGRRRRGQRVSRARAGPRQGQDHVGQPGPGRARRRALHAARPTGRPPPHRPHPAVRAAAADARRARRADPARQLPVHDRAARADRADRQLGDLARDRNCSPSRP